jgi:hypothetical protein
MFDAMGGFLSNRTCNPCKLLIENFSVWKSDGVYLRAVTSVHICRIEYDLLLFIAGYYRAIILIRVNIFGLTVYFAILSVPGPVVHNLWNVCHAFYNLKLNYIRIILNTVCFIVRSRTKGHGVCFVFDINTVY